MRSCLAQNPELASQDLPPWNKPITQREQQLVQLAVESRDKQWQNALEVILSQERIEAIYQQLARLPKTES